MQVGKLYGGITIGTMSANIVLSTSNKVDSCRRIYICEFHKEMHVFDM